MVEEVCKVTEEEPMQAVRKQLLTTKQELRPVLRGNSGESWSLVIFSYVEML